MNFQFSIFNFQKGLKKPISGKNAGIALLMVVVLTAAIFAISIGIFTVVFGEFLISGEISDSFIAFYAADQAIERVLYRDRIDEACGEDGSACNETATGVVSGGCYDITMTKVDDGSVVTSNVIVTGQYWCGTNPVRVVRRAFDLSYTGPSTAASAFNPDTDGTLTDSLVAYWKLDEISGNRLDIVGGNNLSENGSIGFNTGKQTNAAQFGGSQHLSVADGPDFSIGDNSFTVAAWAYMDVKPADQMTVLGKWSAGGNLEYRLYYDNGPDLFRIGASANGSADTNLSASSFGSPVAGSWYFIVAGYDKTNSQVFIQVNDGVVNTTGHPGGAFDGSADFVLGRNDASGGGGLYWQGRIDEVGLWKKVLSSQEVADLYNERLANPVAYWHIDEQSGLRLDAIGGEDLIAVNSPGANGGHVHRAVELNGSNQALKKDTSGVFSTGDVDFTLAAWVYFDNVTNEHTIIAKDTESPGGREYLLYRNPASSGNTKVRFITFNGTDPAGSVFSDLELLANTWHFVVAWHDASENKIFVQIDNGNVVEASSGNPVATGVDFNVGRRTSGTNHLDGRVDEVGVWKKVLSAQERTDLYSSPVGNTYTPP